jgi:hypothetical protein
MHNLFSHLEGHKENTHGRKIIKTATSNAKGNESCEGNVIIIGNAQYPVSSLGCAKCENSNEIDSSLASAICFWQGD